MAVLLALSLGACLYWTPEPDPETLDLDEDGFSPADGDCDDSDPDAHPDAREILDNDVDEDCDGYAALDGDGDGYVSDQTGGDDCDDGDAGVNPGAAEICGDQVDEDCDGQAPLCAAVARDIDDADAVMNGSGGAGSFVSIEGDFDGDGRPAMLIGAYSWNDPDGVSVGALYVVQGFTSGEAELAEVADLVNAVRTGWTQAFGLAAASAGDVDGDGEEDLLVGAPDDAVAYLFAGPIGPTDTESAVARFYESYGSLGRAVGGGADVDGDGYDDIAIGSPRDGNEDRGDAYLFRGPLSGDISYSDADFRAYGRDEDALGGFVDVRDLDGDGLGDLAAGLYHDSSGDGTQGFVVFYAPTDGVASASEADGQILAESGRDLYHATFALADDADGDGYTDVVIGSSQYDASFGEGRAWWFRGPIEGLRDVEEAEAELFGDVDEEFGLGVGAGDLDGDGRSDLVVGSRGFGETGDEIGVSLFASPVEGVLSADRADAAISGGLSVMTTGCSAISASGDVNGDGLDDLLLGFAGGRLFLGPAGL